MQIKFTFNSVDTVTLIPENQKDKDLLKLCFSSSKTLKTVASPAKDIDSITLEISPETTIGLDSQRRIPQAGTSYLAESNLSSNILAGPLKGIL